jgi:hypothetical protein
MLRRYVADVGVPGIAAHDLRRYAECRSMPDQNETVPKPRGMTANQGGNGKVCGIVRKPENLPNADEYTSILSGDVCWPSLQNRPRGFPPGFHVLDVFLELRSPVGLGPSPRSRSQHGQDYAASSTVQPLTGVAATISIWHNPGLGIAPSCAEPLAASLSRFSSSLVTHPSRRQNDAWAPSRIWSLTSNSHSRRHCQFFRRWEGRSRFASLNG